MKLTIPSMWAGLFALITPFHTAVHAATYELGPPFHIACEGTLVMRNISLELVVDDGVSSSNPDDDFICSSVILAEKSTNVALKYTLKENEISRILKFCSVGKLCRIEGDVRNFTHGVFFFVRINSISAK